MILHLVTSLDCDCFCWNLLGSLTNLMHDSKEDWQEAEEQLTHLFSGKWSRKEESNVIFSNWSKLLRIIISSDKPGDKANENIIVTPLAAPSFGDTKFNSCFHFSHH